MRNLIVSILLIVLSSCGGGLGGGGLDRGDAGIGKPLTTVKAISLGQKRGCAVLANGTVPVGGTTVAGALVWAYPTST
jgi:hypothetical protein